MLPSEYTSISSQPESATAGQITQSAYIRPNQQFSVDLQVSHHLSHIFWNLQAAC